MRTFIKAHAANDTRTWVGDWKAGWDFNLGVFYNMTVGLPFSFSDRHKKEAYTAFEEYVTGQYFYSVGGDYSKEHDYQSWLATVNSHPAPISTALRPLSDILPASKHFQPAYDAYLSKCPSTKAGGVCNGLGRCVSCGTGREQADCVCNSGAYKEDSKCYLNCPAGDKGVCNGRGDCHQGRCKCQFPVAGEPFGYKGAACEIKCGQKYYSNHGSCLRVPGSETHCMQKSDENNDCYCQWASGIEDEDMKAIHYESYCDWYQSASAYSCFDKKVEECKWVWGSSCCHVLRDVTCQFGTESSCSEETLADLKAGPLGDGHPRALTEGIGCVDFRKNAIACDELEKARAFNHRLNEGTTATQSRSYDWVREAMTKSGLPGNKWHVGHMCPGGGKPKTWLGNKARNLLAQTAKDNAGRGGLQSKQMTAAEAAFYSRTLTTCADLPPKEELQA